MTWDGVVAVVFIIGAILLFHESGHFLFAKLCRMRVDEFGIGLPLKRPIVAIKRGETIYSLNWIPFGAFVRIAGMEPEEQHLANGFHKRPLWQRAVVLGAGSGMNVVLATLLFLCAGVFYGQPVEKSTVIRRAIPGRPAAKAGLQRGDRIVAVNGCWTGTVVDRVLPRLPAATVGMWPEDRIVEVDGQEVHDFEEMVRRLGKARAESVPVAVERLDKSVQGFSTQRFLLPRLRNAEALLALAPGATRPVAIRQLGIIVKPLDWDTVTGIIRNAPYSEISITVIRAGKLLTRRMVAELHPEEVVDPETGEAQTAEIGLVGIAPEQVYKRLSPLAAIRDGFETTVMHVRGFVQAVARIVLGKERPQVMSIVKIAVEIQGFAHLGWWWVLQVGGSISFAIGVLNILPFPPFDGWRLVYIGYEGVIGRAPDRKKEALINLVGFVVVMFAFVVLVLKDVAEMVANRAVR